MLKIRLVRKKQKGQALVEYATIISLVSIVSIVILSGVGILLAAMAILRGSSGGLRDWLVVEILVFAWIALGVWFVTTRRRRIAAARGLNCDACSYAPHDTEIEDVAAERRCPRCNSEL